MARTTVFLIIFVTLACISHAQHMPLSDDEQGFRNERIVHFTQPVTLRHWEIVADTIDEWKQWEMVHNYSFGVNRGSMSMVADLGSLHPYFRDKVLELIRVCKSQGIDLAVVETYRSHAKQTEYKKMGRRYTRANAGQSKHQYGLAIDVVPMVDSIPKWHNIRLWRKVGAAGERLGLRWGGRWRKLFDPAHFEWTGGLLSADLAKGRLPRVPHPEQYPCLDEDLRALRRRWKAWDSEQSAVAKAAAKSRLPVASAAARTSGSIGEE